MRARLIELRLLTGALTILWTVEAGLILVGYRPGGPADLLVGLAALLPAAVACLALFVPPVARGSRAFSLIAWIGVTSGLLLIPSIASLVTQLTARGSQTILPSLEVAYAWGLAVLATSVYTGLGIARATLGESALRRRRLVAGVGIGLVLSLVSGGLSGSAAVANDAALMGRPAVASRFGPTDASLDLPLCTDPIVVAPAATVVTSLGATVDLRSIGGVDLRGVRNGPDLHWVADAATAKVAGRYGAARIGSEGWLLAPSAGWVSVDATTMDATLLDTRVVETALRPGNLLASAELGVDVVEGARARHCSATVSGADFLAAFPQTALIVGDDDLHGWAGQLEYWVFADGQLGQVIGHVQGEARHVGYAKADPSLPSGILATVRVRMTATDRDRSPVISPP